MFKITRKIKTKWMEYTKTILKKTKRKISIKRLYEWEKNVQQKLCKKMSENHADVSGKNHPKHY
jgi:hypothetical protein